jgi:hypothetical protein
MKSSQFPEASSPITASSPRQLRLNLETENFELFPPSAQEGVALGVASGFEVAGVAA